MPYNPALVAPMRAEMTRMGARELTSAAEVDAALGDQRGSMLVFVNSVCGCAAGNARPALALATSRLQLGRASTSENISPAAHRWRSSETGKWFISSIATKSKVVHLKSLLLI
jgi:hypothetical protein